MDFNQIYTMAIDVINQAAASRGGYLEPNTTVCVILARSGRVFNGVSHNEVHAEIEAVRTMMGFNENTVDSLILVDAGSRLALLPCFSCIRYIVSLNPMNTGAMIMMPDRPVPFQEVISQNQVSGYNSVQSVQSIQSIHSIQAGPGRGIVSAGRSSMVMTGRSKGAVLNSKINNLLAGTEEDEQTDEDIDLMNELTESVDEAKKKKGLLGGLFGKK